MKINLKNKEFYKYSYLLIALLITFWAISIFEVFSATAVFTNLGESILYKIINDYWFVFFAGILFFPVYALLRILNKLVSTIVIQLVFVFLVLIQFGLIKYFLTTLINLGADILGYSYDDISTTVSSSVSFSVGYFVPYVLFVVLFLGLPFVLQKLISTRALLAISMISFLLFGAAKLVLSDASESIFQNKIDYLLTDIYKFKKEQNEINSLDLSKRTDYPFLKPSESVPDVLSPFFNLTDQKPNIVFIIVEGLGGEFVGDGYYGGFTPYLDNLKEESLYWENFLSTSGRTFGVLPALLGSLPFGEQGFLELQKIPSHISLLSVLKANGYTTSFYSGDKSSFDRKINFLEYNGVENIIDEDKFEDGYIKTEGNEGGFSWGYPDSEIFRKTLAELDSKVAPRLDVIMTVTNHEPFSFPGKNVYLSKVDSIINTNKFTAEKNEEVKSYSDIFASLLYSDNSIKNFIETYKSRPDFDNTIFIITGDHRLIPINQKDKLCRFHVPFYIYSPLLKKAQNFKSVSSHFDVTPSILSLLMKNYNFIKLDNVPWISEGLDTVRSFRNIHKIPLMRYKGNIGDFMFKEYLLSDGELYKVNENFGINKVIEREFVKSISDSLINFKRLNNYATKMNKIFPEETNIYMNPGIEFTDKELEKIGVLTKNRTFDQCFELARETAFSKKYTDARLICNYILNEYPNHADARILKGRTLAWEGKYKEAEIELLNVIKRTPYYYDCYLAIMDLYWWSDQDGKSIEMAKKAIYNKVENGDLGFKLAKAYQRMNNVDQSKKIMDSLLIIYPDNAEFKTFNQTLK